MKMGDDDEGTAYAQQHSLTHSLTTKAYSPAESAEHSLLIHSLTPSLPHSLPPALHAHADPLIPQPSMSALNAPTATATAHAVLERLSSSRRQLLASREQQQSAASRCVLLPHSLTHFTVAALSCMHPQ